MDTEEGWSCACSATPCTMGETQVKSCSIAQLHCPMNTMQVATCSVIP
jgi:hypothetical protein